MVEWASAGAPSLRAAAELVTSDLSGATWHGHLGRARWQDARATVREIFQAHEEAGN